MLSSLKKFKKDPPIVKAGGQEVYIAQLALIILLVMNP